LRWPRVDKLISTKRALSEIGVGGDSIVIYTPKEMKRQADADLERATSLASIGQEFNLVKAQRALAERSYHFLVVHAPDDEQARRIADAVKPFNAERAQHHGNFIIEEPIERADDEPHVAEPPDREHDMQTPSGFENERAWLSATGEEDPSSALDMTGDLPAVGLEDTLQRAAQLMAQFSVGALLVCHRQRGLGAVTERDITVRGTAANLRPDETGVSVVMTPAVDRPPYPAG
jgi:hypothetical protein